MSRLSALEAENDSLENIFINADSVCLTVMKPKNDTLAKRNLQHVGLASVVLKSFNAYCARETCGLSHLQLLCERQWYFSAEIGESGWVLAACDPMMAPYQGDFTTSCPKYFTLSFDCDQSFLKFLISAELSKADWNSLYSSDS